eukprot:6481056-Amphidinium_carterae.1
MVREHLKQKDMRVKEQKKLKDANTATLQVLAGLFHALELMGVSWQVFEGGADASWRLGPNCVRYMVDSPGGCGYTVPGHAVQRRVAVKNMGTGQKWFEVSGQWQDGVPPVLVLSGDESSINLKMANFLSGHMKMRTVFIRDHAHRNWNDCKNALADCMLWPDVVEALQCMSTLQGPWKSGQWWRSMVEAADKHMKSSTSHDPLFRRLVEELHGEYKLASEPQSESAYEELWESVRSSNVLNSKGQKVGMCRWFSWVENWQRFQDKYFTHLYYVQ